MAAVEDLPFVLEFGQDRGGESVQGVGVGKDLGDVGPSFDLPVQPLQRICLTHAPPDYEAWGMRCVP